MLGSARLIAQLGRIARLKSRRGVFMSHVLQPQSERRVLQPKHGSVASDTAYTPSDKTSCNSAATGQGNRFEIQQAQAKSEAAPE